MRRPVALSLALLALACDAPPPDTADGLSEPLARERAQRLSDVRYDLAFTIPSAMSERVIGTVAISFTLRGAGRPLVLDFDAPTGSVLAVEARGQAVPFEIVNDHLVVSPAGLLNGAQMLEISFLAGDAALNRHDEFLYTLFVPDRASSAFPCFDQPDLKARYAVTLRVPADWQAVGNGPTTAVDSTPPGRVFTFAETPPISTYLVAFAAGRFTVDSAVRAGRVFHFFHRETDSTRVARNRDAILDLHAAALRWLEDYTGIPYPFPKFAFVAVPDFQYGGMEHPGAVFYRASSLFLDEVPTQNQRLGRASLIAHETAHMWFGDLVTMPWFDDVWMKEVFANFMAAKIVNPAFPEIDHDLRFFLAHHPAAYEVDRTAGANPIRQELDNLREAGTLYGAIIYQKAPIVMRHLERLLGEETMQAGLRAYLDRFRFGNAAWPDLIAILDELSSDDLSSWNRAWVEEPGRPDLAVEAQYDSSGRIERLVVTQRDPRGRPIQWNQRVDVLLGFDDTVHVFPVRLDAAAVDIPDAVGFPRPLFMLPGMDGLAYGRLVLGTGTVEALASRLPSIRSALVRSVAWQALWESVLYGELPPVEFVGLAVRTLPTEPDEQVTQQVLGLLRPAFWRFLNPATRREVAPAVEEMLDRALAHAPTPSRKRAFFDALVSVTLTDAGVARLRNVWERRSTIPGLPLSEDQFTSLAAALALRQVPQPARVLAAQRERITNPDRRARFDFVTPALSSDRRVRDSVAESFGDPKNREREPWVLEALSYLHHPLRAEAARGYVLPSLDLLEEIQRTGDIFFPLRWLDATLDGHQSTVVADVVLRFLDERPAYPPRLRGKILQAADPLFRAARVVHGWTESERVLVASVLEHERHPHVHSVAADLSVLDDNGLLVDPGTLDVLQRLDGAGYAFLNRRLEALGRARRDLGDLRNRH